ncbi:MAG: hypothetical protein HYW64_02035 [Candidatus Levybacteria bacterium]|nr:hypothetical protein [Candidatus Levybacteria bacterium]MBI2622851.1 hypothetical protein [Candidatus Levybacteria bacterium]MBI3093129.1 hypothetical protein [Candidatus Levybacteria bacterium]
MLPVWLPIAVVIFILLATFLIVGFTGAPGTPGTPAAGPQQPHPTSPPNPPITPPAAPSDLRQAISGQFGITMNGFDQQHLQWAWDKLWDVSRTNFITLVRGTTITASSDSEQTGCKTIRLAQYGPQELFNVALIHELGHIILNCSKAYAYEQEHAGVWRTEGGVTRYAQTACTYPPQNRGSWQFRSEDYAEMITYYLNPTAWAQTARCAGRQLNPYLNNGYPLHYNLAKKVLGAYP